MAIKPTQRIDSQGLIQGLAEWAKRTDEEDRQTLPPDEYARRKARDVRVADEILDSNGHGNELKRTVK